MKPYPFFEIEKKGNIATIYLNKPEKRNAMDWSFWRDLPLVVEEINQDKSIHCFLVAGKGKSFSTGLDLDDFFQEFGDLVQGSIGDVREKFYHLILEMQKGINAIYDSPKPSIAIIQKHCIGGGLDLISACDLRYAVSDASFSLREAKVGIVADMGSLQRLPAIIGEGATRELALTGKDIGAAEAFRIGLVNRIGEDWEATYREAWKTAQEIAENPSIVIRGVKQVLKFGRDKSLPDALNYVAVWNAALLDTQDFRKAIQGFRERKKPVFNEETRLPEETGT